MIAELAREDEMSAPAARLTGRAAMRILTFLEIA